MKNNYPKFLALLFIMALSLSVIAQVPNAWINEIHYDDDGSVGGSDSQESIEVVIENPGNWDLSLFVVDRYNGNNGAVYGSDDLSTFAVGTSYGSYTVYSIVFSPNGIQNGAPDGIALSYNSTLIQFLSYEGTFAGTDGIANGITSTDIGVSETNSTPAGQSLQLSGTGARYSDFTWNGPATANPGDANNDQTISAGGDVTPPVFDPGYPNASTILDDKFSLNVKMDEPGTVYYKVLGDGATEPTPAEIKADQSFTVSEIATDTTDLVTGLNANTAYDVYVLAADDESTPNEQASAVKLDVTTATARSLAITQPIDQDSFELSDTVWFKFDATNIDSAQFWIYFEALGMYINSDETFPTAADSVPFPLGNEASLFDSLIIYAADILDPTFTSDTIIIHLIDLLPPVIDTVSPVSGSYIEANQVFSIEFDEVVEPGVNDSITIYRKADDTVFDVINVETDSVWVSDITEGEGDLGYFIQANFMANKAFESGVEYYILLSEGAFVDMSGNEFAGISDKTEWTVKTLGQDLFFSEYIEGSGDNKALEIYNPTASSIDLSDYVIRVNYNGNPWSEVFNFPEGTIIASEEVYVIAHEDADAAILAVADSVVLDPFETGTSYIVAFNGDDVRALCKVDVTDTTIIDVIGRYDLVDPGAGWDVAGEESATKDHTLWRKVSTTQGNTNWDASAGTNSDDSEWKVYPQNTFDNLGLPSPDASSETEITAYTIPVYAISSEIFADKDSIAIELVKSAQLDSLFPVFNLSEGATSDPASGDSTDFSALIDTILITAEDGVAEAQWIITATQALVEQSGTDILDIEFEEQVSDPEINTTDKVVDVYLPYGMEIDTLVPNLTLSPGATSVPASGDTIDFTADSTTITVTAEDGTIQDWKIVTHQIIFEISDIATLRAGSQDGTFYHLTGQVFITYRDTISTRNSVYIQDAGAGIVVDDPSAIITTEYENGNGITGLKGTLGEYGGLLQFLPIEDPGAPTFTEDTVIAPIELTASELITNWESYEARLVKIAELDFVDAGDQFGDYSSYDSYNGTDSLVVRTHFRETDIVGAEIPLTANITGIATEFFDQVYQIFPRALSDIEVVSAPDKSHNANLSDLKVDGETVEGFDVATHDIYGYLPKADYSKYPVVTLHP